MQHNYRNYIVKVNYQSMNWFERWNYSSFLDHRLLVFLQENTIMITGDKTSNNQVRKPLKKFDNELIETQLEKPSKATCLKNLPEKTLDKPLEHVSNDVLKSNSIIRSLRYLVWNCDEGEAMFKKNSTRDAIFSPLGPMPMDQKQNSFNKSESSRATSWPSTGFSNWHK